MTIQDKYTINKRQNHVHENSDLKKSKKKYCLNIIKECQRGKLVSDVRKEVFEAMKNTSYLTLPSLF